MINLNNHVYTILSSILIDQISIMALKNNDFQFLTDEVIGSENFDNNDSFSHYINKSKVLTSSSSKPKFLSQYLLHKHGEIGRHA